MALFSGLGILIWLYWSAIEFNQPAFFAQRLAFHAPGVTPQASLLSLLLGTIASGLWVALVLWRTRRSESRLWRPVLLTAGGLSLSWVLLMALLLPGLEINRGYRPLAEELQTAMTKASPQAAPRSQDAHLDGQLTASSCITAANNDLMGQTIALAMLTPELQPLANNLQARFAQRALNEPECRWLLVYEDNYRPETS